MKFTKLSGLIEEDVKELSEKKKLLLQVKSFQKLSSSVYREVDYKNVVNELKKIIEASENLVLSETDDWMDKRTISRHVKELKENHKEFEKTIKEISVLQNRLEHCYEDCGNVLSKYFSI